MREVFLRKPSQDATLITGLCGLGTNFEPLSNIVRFDDDEDKELSSGRGKNRWKNRGHRFLLHHHRRIRASICHCGAGPFCSRRCPYVFCIYWRGDRAMKLDPSILARIQFAFTVSFHIIFPTMSIGLASFLAVIEALSLKTKNPLHLQLYKFWLSIYAMSFGIGVVTGIVLSFEFSLGVAHFSMIAWSAIGPIVALEVL